MHELSVAAAVLDTVVRHAGGRRVTLVRLRVGELRQVVPDSLELYFGLVTRGTACEGARLEQELVAARLRCGACTHEWRPGGPAFRCPECGAGGATVLTGDELEVHSLVVGGPVAACPEPAEEAQWTRS